MSDAEQLACANCGKRGGLREEVELTATAWQECKVYANPDGSVRVDRGVTGEADIAYGDATPCGDISCSECGETFATWKEAATMQAYEYRCETCGWWGLQDWLHTEGCPGELEKVKHPSLGVAA